MDDNNRKAEEIAKACQVIYGSKDAVGFEECYNSALKMAEWKDSHPNSETVKKIVCYVLEHVDDIAAEKLDNVAGWQNLADMIF